MDDDLNEFATWCWVFSLQFIHHAERLLRPHEMTVAQFTILQHLLDPALKSGSTLSEVSAVVQVKLPAVVKIVDKFESLGLVETEVGKTDRRSRRVTAKPEAINYLNQIKQSLGPFLFELCKTITPEQRKAIVPSLKQMSHWMHEEAEKPKVRKE